ncbi:PTS sugar transporter subunit IIA [Oceanobacillus sojae]|uniref:PTS sugar transporter subunit IIA n=1 Tax=Oceanobacillus sojae TaxID=582851 RepID=UPI0021A68FA3|nr:PTS sugar transporter subunit IIA [Oceanobacillus sojae]MCT1905238.1 PTS sugar transporter subunit IIA [Oceanobacillus sojae]
MFEIVIATHGKLAYGFLDALEMLFGEVNHIHAMSLTKEGIHEFSEEVNKLTTELKEKDTMVFTDIIGGTPFNEFAKRIEEWQGNIKLIGGTNLPVLVETITLLQQGATLLEIPQKIESIGKISYLEDLSKNIKEEDE